MSWTSVLVIAAGAFLFKLAGTFGLGHLMERPSMRAIGLLLPPALLAALVGVQTFTTGTELVIDARAAGVFAGAVAVWRNAPFWVVVVVAAAVTAGIRAMT